MVRRSSTEKSSIGFRRSPWQVVTRYESYFGAPHAGGSSSSNVFARSKRCVISGRLTPQFSGGALSYVPWHFMHDRPLQLLVCSASGTHRDKLGPMGYS